MERNVNIISMWEVLTMDEWTVQANFTRSAFCAAYCAYLDWLSSENTGLRSPWHYSKLGYWHRIYNMNEIDVFMSTRPFWTYCEDGNNNLFNLFFSAVDEWGNWLFMQDYCNYFMNNTIWGMYALIIGIDSSTGAVMGTNRKYKYNRRF